MQINFSDLQTPSFARHDAYDFVDLNDGNEKLYAELIEISKEIEKCRLRNC